MAAVFRQKAIDLEEGLQRDERQSTAREALRQFLDHVVIPGDGLLTVVGNLGSMVDAATELENWCRYKWLRGLATNIICSFGVPQRDAATAVTSAYSLRRET
jgi:hypothetical protein